MAVKCIFGGAGMWCKGNASGLEKRCMTRLEDDLKAFGIG